MKKTKFIVLTLVLLIIAVVVNGIILNNSYNLQIQEYNEQVYALIGTIRENYPEVSDEEIIRILNNSEAETSTYNTETSNSNNSLNENVNSNAEIGKELVQKYGITENEPAILSLEKLQNNTFCGID